MTAVTDIIMHYNNSILNSKSNNKRLLHCINKLYDLRISVNDLQVTRIGRTVSDLRKIDGEVGVAAKALIAKWKSMVVAETISSSESDGDGDNNDNDEPPSSQKSRHRDENVKKKIESDQHTEHNADHKEDRSNGGKEHHHRRHNSDAHSSTDHKHRSSADKHHSKERQHRDHKGTGRAQSAEQNGQSGIGDGDDEENRLIIDIKSEDKHSRDAKRHRSDRKDDKRSSGSSEHRSDKHKSSRNSEKSPQKSSEKADSSDRSNEKSSHHHHRKRHEPSDGTSTSSKRKRPSDDNSPSKQSSTSSKAKKLKSETSTVDEIDSSMGTSFADALGMMMPKRSKGSKQKSSLRSGSSDIIKVSSNDTPKVPSDKTKSSKVSPASSSSSRSERKTKEAPAQPPKLLSSSVALPPLEPVLAVEFPIISNNYKPMPLNPTVMDCVFNNYNQQQPKKFMTDEEAFGSGISSKTMRTKVYSGVKTGAIAQIPSLYQMCIRILQRNIDALEQTGSIPFDILKPVLQLASPEQLFSIESYNPYLMDDTDVLWQFHCQRKFRNLKRLELETWREMFLRCTEEQEARFNNLTDTIKRSQTVAVPLKQTKLAYVNSAVKPPRGIIKKQNQFGTNSKLIATPAARVAALNNVSNNIAKPGDVRLRVAAGLRDTAQVTSNPAKTKSTAPLMQKSLQSFRSRFKR
ncbi:hypothetical protein HA402_007863 [Bradysia odoriphaga]|nr:hypothetical protein HA402_007863 [Bradysia odoriphaga]